MILGLPSLPFDNFNKEVLTEVVRIYAVVSGTQVPKSKIDPEREIDRVCKELKDHMWCEWCLGSSINHHSKLFIHPMYKESRLYLAFDFEGNIVTNSKWSAPVMRKRFHEEVQKYFNFLLPKVN